MRQAAENCSYS